MDISQVHIIQRLEMEFKLPAGRKKGERLSRRLMEVIKQELLPALDREFNRLVMANEYLRLDKLVIDLELDPGDFRPGDMVGLLTDKVVNQLNHEINSAGSSPFLENIGDSQDNQPDKPNKKGTETGNRFVLTNEAQVWETLIYILKTGYYPWWHKGKHWETIEPMLESALESQESGIELFFQPIDFGLTVHRKRFISLLSPKLQEKILQTFFGQADFQRFNKELEVLKKIMTRLFKSFAPYEATAVPDFLLYYQSTGQWSKKNPEVLEEALLFWRKWIGNDERQSLAWQRQLAKWVKTNEKETQKAALIKRLLRDEKNKKQRAEAIASDKNAISDLSFPLRRRLENYLPQISWRVKDATDLRAWIQGEGPLSLFIQEKLLKVIPLQDRALRLAILNEGASEEALPTDRRSMTRGDFPQEGIYVSNAGLVLLHPYLLHFFQAIGLGKENHFVDAAAQEKAVHLLQYLAAKRLLDPDPELVFNKVLCGIPPDQPIARNYQISEEEQYEADHLLNVILGYWKALGSTSIDGLRFNFLLRDGKLSETSDGWKLLVERKPQDMLMDSLPWGFSLFKLPWMDKKMFVEW